MLKRLLNQFFEMPRVYKRIVSASIDCVFIVAAVVAAFFIRDELSGWISTELYYTVGLTTLASVFIWARLGLYRAVVRFIDSKALYTIFIGAVVSGMLMVFIGYFLKTPMPRSVPFIFTVLVLIFVSGSRLVIRGLINAHNSKGNPNVIIYGAGSSGRQLALSLQHGAEFNPVAFVDDNPELYDMSLAGVKVYSSDKLASLVTKYNAEKLLLAIPSASAKARKNLLNKIQALPVDVLTIPGSADLVSGKLQVDSLRRVEIADLLGRDAVQPIDRLFRRCIENKNVLVTGAGGSIGSEICRQIVKQSPMSLVLFEASEFALYSIEKELNELANAENKSIKIIPILASVIDQQRVSQVIKSFDINTIYHAAAYKHVPLVEHNTVSGLRNNVWGTKICAEAAVEHKVENFVLISTDKAVRPTNVMGSSKRLSELVLQALSEKTQDTRFSMVRFGNVLGSSGSVVPLFKKQIEQGGPVTITHPDITRFFMTIPEAAQLVIQAGSMGEGGEVYVLDMGKSIKINDLARKMIQLSGLSIRDDENPSGDIAITYTGLRPGEKLYEELLIGENVEGTEHKRIMKAREISMSWDDLSDLLNALDDAMLIGDVAKIRNILLDAPLGYKPMSEIADCLWLTDCKPHGIESAEVEAGGENKPTDKLRVV